MRPTAGVFLPPGHRRARTRSWAPVLRQRIGLLIVAQRTALHFPAQRPTAQGIGGVKDIEASRRFYEKFGFEVFAGDASQNWLIMKNGDHQFYHQHRRRNTMSPALRAIPTVPAPAKTHHS